MLTIEFEGDQYSENEWAMENDEDEDEYWSNNHEEESLQTTDEEEHLEEEHLEEHDEDDKDDQEEDRGDDEDNRDDEEEDRPPPEDEEHSEPPEEKEENSRTPDEHDAWLEQDYRRPDENYPEYWTDQEQMYENPDEEQPPAESDFETVGIDTATLTPGTEKNFAPSYVPVDGVLDNRKRKPKDDVDCRDRTPTKKPKADTINACSNRFHLITYNIQYSLGGPEECQPFQIAAASSNGQFNQYIEPPVDISSFWKIGFKRRTINGRSILTQHGREIEGAVDPRRALKRFLRYLEKEKAISGSSTVMLVGHYTNANPVKRLIYWLEQHGLMDCTILGNVVFGDSQSIAPDAALKRKSLPTLVTKYLPDEEYLVEYDAAKNSRILFKLLTTIRNSYFKKEPNMFVDALKLKSISDLQCKNGKSDAQKRKAASKGESQALKKIKIG